MTTQTIVDGVTLSAATWGNDVDTAVYSYLTSPAGTNTITATGPANLTSATGVILRFLPAATNTGATTINITPSGGAALGAKNIFLNGAALVGGELRISIPVLIVYDGTQYALLTPYIPGTPTYFRKNAIINGDFNVWQRGTSFAGIADATYSADRWRYGKVGAAIHTVSQSTDVPTVAEAGRLFNYSLLVDCTTVDASIAAGDFVYVDQRIEGYNFLPLAQRACTLSFWVKGTKTGIHCVALVNSATPDRTFLAEYTINTTATWEKKTIAVTASPAAGTWDYTTGIGLGVRFALSTGSTFQSTAGWTTGNFLGTANQVNATDSTSNDFRLCGVQLEAGSVATEFEQRTFQDSLALCQRYYEKTFNYSVAPAQATGINTLGMLGAFVPIGDTVVDATPWKFAVAKRATPTVTTYNPTQANANMRNTGDTGDAAVTVLSVGEASALIYATSGTAQNLYTFSAQAVAEL